MSLRDSWPSGMIPRLIPTDYLDIIIHWLQHVIIVRHRKSVFIHFNELLFVELIYQCEIFHIHAKQIPYPTVNMSC